MLAPWQGLSTTRPKVRHNRNINAVATTKGGGHFNFIADHVGKGLQACVKKKIITVPSDTCTIDSSEYF